jgi:hypothetical protein
MCELKISLSANGIEIETRTFNVDELKVRRFKEIFENDLSELRRVELCPIPEAKEYEDENDWPMTDGI